MSPQTTDKMGALWAAVADQVSAIEAVTFHPATEQFPPTWAIAFENTDVLMVDGLADPDRLVFSLNLGQVPQDQRLATCETLLRVNEWLVMQADVVGSLVLSGDQVVLKGQLRLQGLDGERLRQAVLDLQGAAHAWHYFRRIDELLQVPMAEDLRLERV